MQSVSTLATGEVQPRRKSPRNQLGKLAEQFREKHQAYIAAQVSSMEHALAAGDLLLEAKRQVAHGQWGEWIEHHCKISIRTAQRLHAAGGEPGDRRIKYAAGRAFGSGGERGA